MDDATKIARHYDESKNEMGGAFPGVPLRDLTQAEYDSYAPWIQASIDASPMYKKTPIKPTTKAEKD